MELERFLPGTVGEIWYEHWHRYHFAAPLADGRDVLDIACGEGYGSALLATRAKHVTGVDIAPDIITHARRRYGSAPNLEFQVGRSEAIPLADASVDLVVSFETLEHIPSPEALVAEAARVLRPDGVLCISTPNKEIYSDRRGYKNEFHVHELYRDEFVQLLKKSFGEIALYGQRVDAYSAIWPVSGEANSAELHDARRHEADKPLRGIADAMYYVAICGRSKAPVARGFSLLSDRDHWMLEDYAAVMRRMADIDAHVARIDAAYAAAQQQIAALVQERDRLAARLAQLETKPPGSAWKMR